MATSSFPSAIVVPVHDDEEWLCHSPGEAAKARLEGKYKSPATSPEELQAKRVKADVKAQALHELHLDAVKRRAQRDLERVAEAERRRVRQAAAEKQRLEEKAAMQEKKVMDRKEAQEAQAAEKRAHREALKHAFFESRARMAADASQRVAILTERQGSAVANREKLLQATVHKANYEVKHALAVATAAKEKERMVAARTCSNLEERMAAAASRRQELLGAPPAKSPRPATSSDTSSGTSSGVGKELASHASHGTRSSKERARQVAQLLNDEAVSLELKRKRLADAMAKALRARDARLQATVRRAAAHRDKAERAKAALQARHTSAESLAHRLIERGQAAEVRRALNLRPPSHKKLIPCSIEVELPERAGAVAAPAALVARLSAWPPLRPDALAQRRVAAAERRALRVAQVKRTVRTVLAEHAEGAASRRAQTLEARRTKLTATDAAVAQAVATARTERVTFALAVKTRSGAAAAKRVAKDVVALGLLQAKAEKRAAAALKRVVLLGSRGAQCKRAAAVATKRAAFDQALVVRGVASAKRLADAAERRAAVLSARVASAKLSAIGRSTAVKLTQVGGGAVRVRIIAPGDATDGASETESLEEIASSKEAPKVEKEETKEESVRTAADERGFFGKLLSLFGR